MWRRGKIVYRRWCHFSNKGRNTCMARWWWWSPWDDLWLDIDDEWKLALVHWEPRRLWVACWLLPSQKPIFCLCKTCRSIIITTLRISNGLATILFIHLNSWVHRKKRLQNMTMIHILSNYSSLLHNLFQSILWIWKYIVWRDHLGLCLNQCFYTWNSFVLRWHHCCILSCALMRK